MRLQLLAPPMAFVQRINSAALDPCIGDLKEKTRLSNQYCWKSKKYFSGVLQRNLDKSIGYYCKIEYHGNRKSLFEYSSVSAKHGTLPWHYQLLEIWRIAWIASKNILKWLPHYFFSFCLKISPFGAALKCGYSTLYPNSLFNYHKKFLGEKMHQRNFSQKNDRKTVWKKFKKPFKP